MLGSKVPLEAERGYLHTMFNGTDVKMNGGRRGGALLSRRGFETGPNGVDRHRTDRRRGHRDDGRHPRWRHRRVRAGRMRETPARADGPRSSG